jgi:hypothetical protein
METRIGQTNDTGLPREDNKNRTVRKRSQERKVRKGQSGKDRQDG